MGEGFNELEKILESFTSNAKEETALLCPREGKTQDITNAIGTNIYGLLTQSELTSSQIRVLELLIHTWLTLLTGGERNDSY